MDRYEKQKNDNYQPPAKNVSGRPDRGGCLSAFLALNIFANGLLLVFIIGAFMALRASGEYAFNSGTEVLIYAGFVILVARFISAVGLWNWKMWGYQGIMVCFGITIVFGTFTGDFTDVVRSIIWGAILYKMVEPIKAHLE
jgi:hypothetical protein